jgi:hypothetical protein
VSFLYSFLNFLQPGILWPDIAWLRPMLLTSVIMLKLAAVITRNMRLIRLYFASHWPSASIFQQALPALNSG